MRIIRCDWKPCAELLPDPPVWTVLLTGTDSDGDRMLRHFETCSLAHMNFALSDYTHDTETEEKAKTNDAG